MIDKKIAKKFRTDFQKTVQKLEKQYGMRISLGNIRYTSDELKSTVTATSVGKGATKRLSLSDFSIGDKVSINHRKTKGQQFEVVKKAIKNVQVRNLSNGGLYTVAPSLLIKL
tara:strand:- start:2064 stop:2402 length:339 start_codon:yes stop_codon:yes gene_type:complete